MITELTEDQIKKMLQGISIPPQPQIMVDLQMEQFSPDCNIQRISQLISQDIGLSGSILKTVNSSFYGLPNKITSIQQACNLLGIKSVINIVNALCIKGALSDDNIVGLNRFWDSAMDVAHACTAIAKHIGFESPDEAYTLGLFHNCGIALLMLRFDNFNEVLNEAYAQTERRVIDIENQHYDTNHAVVGYYVAKSWNLPAYICEAIAEHHGTDSIFTDIEHQNLEKKNLLAILKMAEYLCELHHTLGNQAQDHEWMRLEENILKYIGLSSDDLQTLKETCAEQGLGSNGYLTS